MSYKKVIIHTVKECWEEETPEPTEVTELYAPETYEAKRKIGNIFTTVSNENTPLGVDLRLDLRDFFSKLLSTVNSYIEVKAYEAGQDEAAFLRESLTKQAGRLKDVLRYWFRFEQLEEPSIKTVDFFNKVILAVDSIYTGTTPTPDLVAKEIDSLSESYRMFNPFILEPGGLNELLHAYFTAVINQANAKKNKDWPSEHSAQNLGYRIFIEGQESGTRSISDILSIAIIQGQPWRFQ